MNLPLAATMISVIAVVLSSASTADDLLKTVPTTVDSGLKAAQTAGSPEGDCSRSPYPSDEALWRGVSCDDLFSEQPDMGLKTLGFSGKWKKDLNWWPVCSLTFVNQLRSFASPIAWDAVLEAANNFGSYFDLCDQGETALRGSAAYTAPSRQGLAPQAHLVTAKLLYTIMPQAVRKDLTGRLNNFRDNVTELCCGKDMACRAVMARTQVDWCKGPENPAEPDPCTTSGAFVRASSAEMRRFRRYETERRVAGFEQDEFRIKPRIVVLPEYVSTFTGSALATPDTITHEFGHVCSSVKAQIGSLHYSDDLEAYRNGHLSGDRKRSCRLTPAAERSYEMRFRAVGASDESIACFVDLAHNIVKTRFTGKACPLACPRQALEETFADWIGLLALSPAQQRDALRTNCFRALRDNEHPLSSDTLRCMLRTPSFRQALKASTGCR